MLKAARIVLDEVLKFAHEPHQVEASRKYPNVGIYSFGRGVFRKPDIDGMSTSATTLYRIRRDQLIYSRLFAFEGAYAVVPAEFDGYFVSNEFPTFDIDTDRVLPGYLGWLFRYPPTWRALAASATGMGDRRKRIHPERLQEHAVELPSIDQQRRMIALFDTASKREKTASQASDDVAHQLDATLKAAFERTIRDAPRMRMGDVAPLVRRPVVIAPEARYQELGVRSFGRGLFSKPDLIGSELTWQKLFRIESRDIVFSNIKAWEGAFAVAREEHHGKFGSHRYLTCVAAPEKVLPDFLWYYLQSPMGLEQVQIASPGSADRNRTLSQIGLEDITVPIPSLEVQRWFVSIQRKISLVKSHQKTASAELDKFIPAILSRAFT